MVANSCPCFLHVASRSLSNALFLLLAPRRQMWPAVNTSGGTYMDASPRALEPCSMGGAQDKGGARIDRIEEAHCWQTAVSPETPQSSAFQVSLISSAGNRRSYQNCEPSLSLLLTSLLD